jgi:aconitase A
MTTTNNPFGAESKLSTQAGDVRVFRLNKLTELGVGHLEKLPFSIKVLLESCLRNLDNFEVDEDDVTRLAAWNATKRQPVELPFKPRASILQDFTGVPAVVDLAAMRAAMKRAGWEPAEDQPARPVDLVIDHSVQVDEYASPLALLHNVERSSSATASATSSSSGAEGVPELRGRSARARASSPGEPRVPTPRSCRCATASRSRTRSSGTTRTRR